jgi:hypothetical protein
MRSARRGWSSWMPAFAGKAIVESWRRFVPYLPT